jgi:hypothetical protein
MVATFAYCATSRIVCHERVPPDPAQAGVDTSGEHDFDAGCQRVDRLVRYCDHYVASWVGDDMTFGGINAHGPVEAWPVPTARTDSTHLIGTR